MDDRVTLLADDKRHKQLVVEHGPHWEVLKGPEKVICFGNATGVFIGCTDGCKPRHTRWERMSSVFFHTNRRGK